MATLNGKPVSIDDLLPLALVDVGHFTSMRVDEGAVRGLELHMARLAKDCAVVWGADLDTGRVRAFVREALHGRSQPCVVRVTVYDPAVDMGHLAAPGEPQVLVTVRGAGALRAPAPLRARSVPYERELPEVKHVGLFGALHTRRGAQLAGFDDALFVGRDGRVSEGPTWNVGFVDADGGVVWPQAPVLPGVTRALLQQRAAHRVAPVTLEEAKGMAAAFATNTSIGVRAIAAIDDTALLAEHPVLDRLREAYLSVPGERP
ncbi:aminotransferase class IV family protein [Streptomyces sp. NPDC059917]|uniref:aminotransferase class IV family protein n=1 Tax=Streptomyces sp. NPDC059917 TaxID=3347002 RepID=UPI00365E1C71